MKPHSCLQFNFHVSSFLVVFFSCGTFYGQEFGNKCGTGVHQVNLTTNQWSDCGKKCDEAAALYGKGCCQEKVTLPNEEIVSSCIYVVGAQVIIGGDDTTKAIDCSTGRIFFS